MAVNWADWTAAIAVGVASVPDKDLIHAAALILRAGVVLTAGNGGSSSLASHAAQAVAKPSYKAGGGMGAICLNDNIPTLTAHANDGGWDDALVETAKPLICGIPRCAVMLFSSSGKSENICRLARLAKEWHHDIIAFTGFDGEPLRSFATVSLHVDSHDYEVVEPVHDALIHRMQYHLRELQPYSPPRSPWSAA